MTTNLERVIVAGSDDVVTMATHHVDSLLMSADSAQSHQTAAR